MNIGVREGPSKWQNVPEHPGGGMTVYDGWEWMVTDSNGLLVASGRAQFRFTAIRKARRAIRHLPQEHAKPWTWIK